VYKPKFSHEKARKIILEGAGTHFDPDVVEAFVRCEDKFIEVANALDASLAKTQARIEYLEPPETETEVSDGFPSPAHPIVTNVTPSHLERCRETVSA
jgi:hypothetical protein